MPKRSRKTITGAVKKRRQALRRKQETQEQREIRLLKQRMWIAAKRSRETIEEREIRLARGREYGRSKRAARQGPKRNKQMDTQVEVLNYQIMEGVQKIRIKRKQETPEQRHIRLLKQRIWIAGKRSQETQDEREIRLARGREYVRSKRARERELLREVEKEQKMLEGQSREAIQEMQNKRKISRSAKNTKKEQESIEGEEKIPMFETVLCNAIKEEPIEEVEESINNPPF